MSKKHFLRGLRDGIPIGLGYFAVSFGIGISAHNAHLSIFQGFLLSFLNNASSGEYGGITIIAADSGLWAMALMMLVVNARYLLMSCALSQRLSPDTPLPWRLLIAYDLTDEIFGLAIAQPGYLEVWYTSAPCARPCRAGASAPCSACDGESHARLGRQRLLRDAVRHVSRHHHPRRQAEPHRARLHRRELSLLASCKRFAVHARAVRGHAHPGLDHRDLCCRRHSVPAQGG